jgi:hypothetical protein
MTSSSSRQLCFEETFTLSSVSPYSILTNEGKGQASYVSLYLNPEYIQNKEFYLCLSPYVENDQDFRPIFIQAIALSGDPKREVRI